MLGQRCAVLAGAAMLIVATLWLARPSQAIPYFARKYDTGCSTCHTTVPKLNQTGLDFRASGYRLPGYEDHKTIPLAAWIGGRYENRPDAGVDKTFVDKVELISGGSIGSRVSYFVEWRAVSLGLQNNGELSDRSGRFEDLFFSVDLANNLALTVGQFRLFNQFDNSLRLSASTPLALGESVRGIPQAGDSARQAGLRGFSPAGRSPAAMLTYRIGGGSSRGSAEGFYLHASVPFPGELSIPLTSEARDRASFEFDADPKGVFFEGYYRLGLSSIGGSAFVDDGRQLYTGLLSIDPGRWNTTVAYSSGVIDGNSDRRLSWWNEYRPWQGVNLGFRLDESSFSAESYHVYGDFQLPYRRGLLWLLVEQQFRKNADRTIVQLNGVF